MNRSATLNSLLTCFAALVVSVPLEAVGADDPARERGTALVRALEDFARSDQRVLVIKEGDYLIPSRPQAFHLHLHGLSTKKIVGKGARLLFSDPHRGGISIRGSEGITLEGLELDWKIKPYVIGAVRSIEDGVDVILRVAVRPDFANSVPHLRLAEFTWATVHRANGTRRLLPVRDVVWLKLESQASALDLVLRASGDAAMVARYVKPDDWLLIVARHSGTHAVQIENSHNINLTSLSIRSSPGMGVVALPGSSNIRIEGNVIQTARAANWISSNSDGIHLIGTGGVNVIRNNVLEGLQDDAIVVSQRGSWGVVRNQQIAFRSDSSTGISGASNLLLIPESGPPIRMATAFTKTPDGFFEIPAGPTPTHGMRVAVFPDEESSSVLIEDNQVSNVRGTGIRICRANVRVRRNKISLTVESAITAGPWLHSAWHPQMPATDVHISENTIRQPTLEPRVRDRRGQIEVACWPMTWCAGRDLNRNVQVTNNVFEGGTGYARENQFISGGR
jgi:hypothetical protein